MKLTRIKASPSQWSQGKVHQLGTLFSGEISTLTLCGRRVHGEKVGSDVPVTCRHCLVQIEIRSR